MPATNVLANLFVTIDNTESRRKSECIILPTSKLGTSVLNTLKKDGYIKNFEHIDIPGIKYDPKIGILGLDVSVRLTRPGFNIRIRSRHRASVGVTHKITPAEAKAYLTKEFGVVVS